jgi:hypothetical protein
MTGRDILWRSIGVALSSGACAVAMAMDGSPLIIVMFPVALIGLTLMINGKRVVTALRAERRGHCHTAEVIHAVRIRRHRRRFDEPPA